jgi:hypothetical protein
MRPQPDEERLVQRVHRGEMRIDCGRGNVGQFGEAPQRQIREIVGLEKFLGCGEDALAGLRGLSIAEGALIGTRRGFRSDVHKIILHT